MRFVLPMVAVAMLWGCANDTSRYPAPPACEGTLCNGITPGGTNPGTGGADAGTGTGGAAATIDQSGTVYRVTSPTFDDTPATSYPGAVTVHAISDVTHTSDTAPYGGAAGTTFNFTGIPSGPTWFLAEDASGGTAGVISTFSRSDLPVLPSLAIPLVDRGTLENIALSLPTLALTGVSSQLAHVILFVNRGGAPSAGASVATGTGNAQIVYDFGSGYSDSATATGSLGIAILFNASLTGESSILITDNATNKTYTATVQAGLGAATMAGIELP